MTRPLHCGYWVGPPYPIPLEDELDPLVEAIEQWLQPEPVPMFNLQELAARAQETQEEDC